MYINGLAGRRAGDASACAVLPWVTDFSSPEGGNQSHLRDLTRTKFRLTKGEHQLDATYFHLDQSESGPSQKSRGSDNREEEETFVPHHLLDMMPNLAYYTYKVFTTISSNYLDGRREDQNSWVVFFKISIARIWGDRRN